MQYDPIKRSLGNVFNRSPFLRKTFYKLLDLLLLRAWHTHKALKSFAKKKGNESLEVLDAGAGFGQYSYYMSKLGKSWNITSIDVKEEQVADCNSFFERIGKSDRVKFQVGDLTKFVVPNTYDLILCVDVMEHIEEDVQVFKNYFQSFKQGGMLLISTPSDQGGSDVHEDSDESFIDEHVRDGYNIDEIQDKLRSAGFEKIEAWYGYGKYGKVSWRLSMKYPMTLLNKSKLFFIILPFYYLLTYPISFILNKLDVSRNNKTGTGLMVRAWK